MKKSRLIIMDIIIVILVVLNAAMIIAVAENYNDENRTYNTRWFMNLYKNDEYGRAVDYASRDKIVIDNIQDNELDESIAVAEYYNAEFYKNVFFLFYVFFHHFITWLLLLRQFIFPKSIYLVFFHYYYIFLL